MTRKEHELRRKILRRLEVRIRKELAGANLKPGCAGSLSWGELIRGATRSSRAGNLK